MYKNFYKGIWTLDIPAKVKIHVWRLFHNLVPHYGNLARRTLCEETVCPLCKTELESSSHLLWTCAILQDIWDDLKVQTHPPVDSLEHKESFIRTFLAVDNSTKNLIAISLWSLWHCRNKVVHEGVIFSKQETLGFIRGYARELSFHTANFSSVVGPAVKEFWKPPNDGIIKINFDASFS